MDGEDRNKPQLRIKKVRIAKFKSKKTIKRMRKRKIVLYHLQEIETWTQPGSRGGKPSVERMREMRAKEKRGEKLSARQEYLWGAFVSQGYFGCGICKRELENMPDKSRCLCVDPYYDNERIYTAVICKSCAMRWTPLQLHNVANVPEVIAHIESFVDSGIKAWARYKLQNLPFERANRLARWLKSLPITTTTPRINPLARDYKRRMRNKCKRLIGSQVATTTQS